MIDNYIADQSPRITMTLSEILANTPPVQTLAQATDVPGTNLEWMYTVAYPTGAWYGDLGELGTTAFRDGLFAGYLALGVTCKVSGVPYSWGGAGVGWNYMGSGPQYVGTNIPLSGSYIGQLIRVDNAAVPGGRSILRWNGTLWAPPAGEVVAAESSDTYLVDIVATGFNISGFTYVFASPQVVPEYMFPIGTAVIVQMSGGLADSTNTGPGDIQAGLTANMTPQGDSNDTMTGLFIPNVASFFRGPGFGGRVSTRISSNTMIIDRIDGQTLRGVMCLGGPLKFRAAIRPSAATNRFAMKSYKVVAQ